MKNGIYRKKTHKPGRSLLAYIAFAGTFALASCTSSPVAPTQELQSAEQAINQAEQARVADYASPQLREAREKLTAAKTAVHEENMILAKRLAEESKVEADLAFAKAQVVKAQLINDEIQKGTDSMRQEMQRNTGVQ